MLLLEGNDLIVARGNLVSDYLVKGKQNCCTSLVEHITQNDWSILMADAPVTKRMD